MNKQLINPEFLQRLSEDQNLQEAVKNDPIATLKQYIETKNPLTSDYWIYRIVVFALGFTVLLCTVFSFLIAKEPGAQTPEILIALGSAAVGALAGLLAPSPRDK